MLCLCLADGVALGAAVASSQVSVQVIVFFAVILHKVTACVITELFSQDLSQHLKTETQAFNNS